jgi:hypothetical protein
MSIGDFTGGIIIAAFVAQTAMTSYQAATYVLASATPPPIEGVGFGPDTVTAGEVVLVRWQITKRTDCPGENARVWAGAHDFSLHEPLGPTTLPATGKLEVYPVQTKIPQSAPAGTLRLSVRGFYQCPGTERIEFSLGPVTMEVVE